MDKFLNFKEGANTGATSGKDDIFAKSSKLVRSPTAKTGSPPLSGARPKKGSPPKSGAQPIQGSPPKTGAIPKRKLTPPRTNTPVRTPVAIAASSAKKASDSGRQMSTEGLVHPPEGEVGLPPASSKLEEAKKLVDELYSFINSRSNVHLDIKKLAVSLRSTVIAAEVERQELLQRCEIAEAQVIAAKAVAMPSQARTPLAKRKAATPDHGPTLVAKRQRTSARASTSERAEAVPDGASGTGEEDWQVVRRKPPKPPRPKPSEAAAAKPKPRRVHKGDALVVKLTGELSYAELLRKVRVDPKLQELGANVVKTRRTQAGDMLFELRKDPTVQSSNYQKLVEQSLGEAGQVKALSQRVLVECKNLDEITTTVDLSDALRDQLKVDVAPADIRLRKAYGDMQTATLNVPEAIANKMLASGKIKVGWSVCTLVSKRRIERCFRCMGFGHRAAKCKAPDRSKLCRRCGEDGHFARGCSKPPRCLLCTVDAGNKHATGGPLCAAYRRALQR